MGTHWATHLHNRLATPTGANRTVAVAVTTPLSTLQDVILTRCNRRNSPTANTHPSHRSRATANGSSTTRRHTTTRSLSFTRMPSDFERQHLTGWSSTTLPTEMAAMLQSLHRSQARRMCRRGNQPHAFRLHRDLPPRLRLYLR